MGWNVPLRLYTCLGCHQIGGHGTRAGLGTDPRWFRWSWNGGIFEKFWIKLIQFWYLPRCLAIALLYSDFSSHIALMNDFLIDCISMINYNLSNTGVRSQALTTPYNFHFWISDLSITSSSISSSIYTFPEWSSLQTALVASQLVMNKNDRARNTVVFTIFITVFQCWYDVVSFTLFSGASEALHIKFEG